jgi:hypothetical protein
MHPRKEGLVAVTEILDVFHVEILFLGFKDRSCHGRHLFTGLG